jgi:transposase
MDLVHVIRHKVLVEGQSRRRVADELGVSRNTVKKYIEAADPAPCRVEPEPRSAPTRARIEPRIAEILQEWKGRTTAKQCVTGTRIHRQLVEEGHKVGLTLVREILAEGRRLASEASIPLIHHRGEVAQVDFFEVTVDIDGRRRKAWKFVMRLMYSGRDFIWLYERCDQLSLLDAHVRAFTHFGAIPQRIVYDNMRAAVKRFLRRGRELNARFHALVNHYLFEPCFARPYRGDDKGGVEARGGAIRRQHLTPIPDDESLEAVAQKVLGAVEAESLTKRRRGDLTVAECFEAERPMMLELPTRTYVVEKATPVGVSRSGLVKVEAAVYSVPCTWKSLEATAYVGVTTVRIVCRGEEVVAPRQGFGGRCVRQRHYLPEFARKPQALRQNAAELMAELGEPFGALWRLLVDAHGPRDAARLMAGVVGAIIKHGEAPIAEVVTASLRQDRLDLLGLAQLRPRLATNPVPPALAGHRVEQARAADFDHLLLEAGHE